MKQLIRNEGVVNVTYYDYDGSISPTGESAYYNVANAAYYYNARESGNHSVAIVGWNDDYPSTNFNIAPPGAGVVSPHLNFGSERIHGDREWSDRGCRF